MRVVRINPGAAALTQSLRGLGYSPETALADLIDNSIAAGALRVEIDIAWAEGAPRVAVLDDGAGLDAAGLAAAMQFGGLGPAAVRGGQDLGRFGLGLKTASLSQCRRMSVFSRRDGVTSALAWDIDEIEARGEWDAIVPDVLPGCGELGAALNARANGTLIVWERMDEVGGLAGLDKETFFARIQDIRAHLGMVFHRFLSGDARRISVDVNGRAVVAWDPFLRGHPATITMQTERLRGGANSVSVTPYVLPHRDRFANEADYEAAAGQGGWTERQGFYVYRAKRLVVAGGWLGLGGSRGWTREESSRLARIAIELTSDADAEWRIDVRKSVARPPGRLRARLTALASACRQNAREVFAWRGGRGRNGPRAGPAEEFWVARDAGAKTRYVINRQHPAVQILFQKLEASAALLEGALALAERSVPVERIWLDVSEQGAAVAHVADEGELRELGARIAGLARGMDGDALTNAETLLRTIPSPPAGLREAVLNSLEASDE